MTLEQFEELKKGKEAHDKAKEILTFMESHLAGVSKGSHFSFSYVDVSNSHKCLNIDVDKFGSHKCLNIDVDKFGSHLNDDDFKQLFMQVVRNQEVYVEGLHKKLAAKLSNYIRFK